MENSFSNTGKVKFFNEDKGYGFIVDSDTGKEYFFHVTKIKNKVTKDDEVKFNLENSNKGIQAVDVRLK